MSHPHLQGFECPDGDTIGPNGQPLAHPSFAHPTSCRCLLLLLLLLLFLSEEQKQTNYH